MNNLLISLGFFIFYIIFARHQKREKKYVIFSALFVFLYILFCGIFIVANYFTGEGINDAVIYHLAYGLSGAGFKEYSLIIWTGAGFLVLSLAASWFHYYFLRKTGDTALNKSKTKRVAPLILLLAATGLNPTTNSLYAYFGTFHPAMGFFNIGSQPDEEISTLQKEFNRYYLRPQKNRSGQDRPNLVYIYAESLEQTYFDEQLFPGLVPNLKQIMHENTAFTDINQVIGDGFTISGMTASQCGAPLFTPSGGNSMGGMEKFYEGAYSIGKFLSSENYNLHFRGGARLEFAGKGKFYRTHGFTDAKGYEKLRARLDNPENQSEWGLYDDNLFDIVFNDFIKLSEQKDNFALFTLTLDTHHPHGHPTPSCQDLQYQDGSVKILNAVACADRLISNLIRKIQASAYGDNTVIVVTSDHLALKTDATSILEKGDRKNLFMIIDPRNDTPEIIDKKGSMVDVAPTLLYSMGYDTPLGLGRNLQSDSESLITEIPNYKNKLIDFRPVIEKFWNNPKLGSSFFIDKGAKTISFNGTTYKYPVLIEIKENEELMPYFEFNDIRKLSDRLLDLGPDTPFVWIDKTNKLRYLDQSIETGDGYSVGWGKLGSAVKTKSIDGSKLLSTELLTSKNKVDDSKEVFAKRQDKLQACDYKNRYQDRWSKGKKGSVEITCLQDEEVQLIYWTNNPEKQQYQVTIKLNGETVVSEEIPPFKSQHETFNLKEGRHLISLEIEETFNPFKLKTSADNRDLGVAFYIVK